MELANLSGSFEIKITEKLRDFVVNRIEPFYFFMLQNITTIFTAFDLRIRNSAQAYLIIFATLQYKDFFRKYPEW